MNGTYVVVYNPVAGSINGRGIVNSPLGSYKTDPSLTGKANYQLYMQYKKYMTTPNGTLSFKLKAANLDFSSTSLDWLVVNGAYAKALGMGTINGQGNYAFLVTVRDGDSLEKGYTDQFRIQIWSPTTEQVVYDIIPQASDDEY